jgi:hypothetical protein
MNINVHIERLILDGLPASRHHAPSVQAAIEGELVHMLSTSGLSAHLMSGVALPFVYSDGIQLTNQNEPKSLGKRIAGAVFSGIGNKRGSLSK